MIYDPKNHGDGYKAKIRFLPTTESNRNTWEHIG